MNRNVAIVVTIVTILCCGLPGIGTVCFAVVGMLGANMPGFYEQNPTATQEQVWLGAGIIICLGVVLLLVPVIAGIFTFQLSKKEESATIDTIDYIPPAS